MKKAIWAGILLLALLACPWAGAESGPEAYLGRDMPDFTVTTIAGEEFTLSQALKEKKAVLINLWATWCPPCEMEFPFLQQAYERYRDKVEVIALSVEPGDTREKLAAYAESHGLTFPVASDSQTGLGGLFVTVGIPTTVAVDRFGHVALIEIGAQASAAPFENLFAWLTDDGYAQTRIFQGFPKSAPVVRADGAEEELSAAVGMAAALSADESVWPFQTAMVDGEVCVRSGNAGQDDTRAEIIVAVQARAGDALAMQVKVSSEKVFDELIIERNGVSIRRFSGEWDWLPYAVLLEEGRNEIAFTYAKDGASAGGDDRAYLKSFALLSGEEARAALESNPVYPYAEETALEIVSEGVREIVFSDGEQPMTAAFGVPARFYIVNGEEAAFAAALADEGHDCEDVLAYSSGRRILWSAYDLLDGPLTTPVDTQKNGDTPYTVVYLYDRKTGEYLEMAILLAYEEDARWLESLLIEEGFTTGYREAGESGPDASRNAEETYAVIFADQNGDPVPGCIVNFCTDFACVPVVSDESGRAAFTGEPSDYHLQVIRVPEGYSFDMAREYYTGQAGEEIHLTVVKE